MHPGLLVFLGFAAAVTAVLGIYSIVSDLFLRDRSRVSQRVDDEFRSRQRERLQKSLLFKDLASMNSEAAEEVAKENSWRQRLDALIEQSGLDITPRQLTIFIFATAMVFGLLAVVLSQHILVVLVALLLGAYAPLGYVQMKRRARLNRLLAQLSDAFELLARCIRAGQTMSQSLQAVADEFTAPISHEFSLCFEQMNLGLSPEYVMRDLARRTGLLEIKIFVPGGRSGSVQRHPPGGKRIAHRPSRTCPGADDCAA